MRKSEKGLKEKVILQIFPGSLMGLSALVQGISHCAWISLPAGDFSHASLRSSSNIYQVLLISFRHNLLCCLINVLNIEN